MVVAEKESLSGDRDMLLQQLSKANTEASFFKDNIATLKQCVAAANNVKKNCLNDVIIEKELSSKKEKLLNAEIDKMKVQNMELATELDRAGSELISSLKENAVLNGNIKQIEEEMNNERLARERERAALSIALDSIDNLTSQIEGLKSKDEEKEIALDMIAKIERERETSRYNNFELQQEIMVLRSEAEEADERNSVNILQIERLESFKNKYSNENELNLLKDKIIELNEKLVSSATEVESLNSVSNVRISSSGKEIERLALDLLNTQKELKNKDDSFISLQNELNELKLKCQIEEKMRLEAAAVTVIVAQAAETKQTISELILSLQTNRQLNDELVMYKNKLEEEQSSRIAHDELALLSVTNKAKQVDDAIECSKTTLYRAAQEVDNMKRELDLVEVQKNDLERQLQLAELHLNSLRVALAAAITESEKNSVIQTALQNEIQKLTFDKEAATEAMVRAVEVSASTVAAAAADNTRICNLRASLEKMTQLKEIAEKKVVALALAAATVRQLHVHDNGLNRAQKDQRHDRSSISEDGSTDTDMRHDQGFFSSHSENFRHPDLAGQAFYNRPSGRSLHHGDQRNVEGYDGTGLGSGPGGRHQQDVKRPERGRSPTPTYDNIHGTNSVLSQQPVQSYSISPQSKYALLRSQNSDARNTRTDPKSTDPSSEHGLSTFAKPILRSDISHTNHSRGGALGNEILKDVGSVVHSASPTRIRHDRTESIAAGNRGSDMPDKERNFNGGENREVEAKGNPEINVVTKERNPPTDKDLSNISDREARREREILLNKILYGDSDSINNDRHYRAQGSTEEKSSSFKNKGEDDNSIKVIVDENHEKSIEKNRGNQTQIKNLKQSVQTSVISKSPAVKSPWLVSKVKGENWNYSPSYSGKKVVGGRGGGGGGPMEEDLLDIIGDDNSSTSTGSTASLSSGLNIGTANPGEVVGRRSRSRSGSPGGSGSMSPQRDLGSGSPDRSESRGGSTGKDRMDAAGLRSTEFRSLDDHFLHY